MTTPGRKLARRLARLDRRLLRATVRGRSPVTDRVLTGLSNAADNGLLWYAVAGTLAATGRRRPRSAAAAGLLGLGIASGLVNGPLKFLWRRDRPASDALGVAGTLLPLPRTFSFPSGHSASAFAFATGVTASYPAAGAGVAPLAAGVAYSRIHTGVHYPSDVVVGSAVGAAAGLAAARIVRAARASSVHTPDTSPLDVPVPRRAVVVANPDSGSADDLDAALAELSAAGFTVTDRIAVDEIDALAARLSGPDVPLVIATGGDGTVGAVANAVHGTEALLAIVPLGTSNDVARSLGIPPDGRDAARAIVTGQVCAIDAGEVRLGDDAPRLFLNATTVGLNVAFAKQATRGGLRDLFGGLTYPIAAAAAVRRFEPFEVSLAAGTQRRRLRLVHLSVSNATVFGGVLGMRVPGASLTDGKLDVIAAERLSPARLALAVGDTFVGRHRPVHGVHATQLRELVVSAEEPVEVAVDGEVVGRLPARLRVLPAALRVVVPRAEAG